MIYVDRLGFMQGRLSPIIDGRIQCFPWGAWQKEFEVANNNNFHLLEWTLDQEKLQENPLMNVVGQEEIKRLMQQYQIIIPSLTGDCFMQEPFYKVQSAKVKRKLLENLNNIIVACGNLGILYIVMPLVDNGSLENQQQVNILKRELADIRRQLHKNRVKLIFESDFEPNKLVNFISGFDHNLFGINYDIGNSAAFGFNPEDEITSYGDRIMNVHVKDRRLNGGTVPLGEGDADLPKVFQLLQGANYKGDYILQTARAENDDHVGALCKYRELIATWI